MSVELHVDGVIETGRFAEFLDAAQTWATFREKMGWAKARILCGFSRMNSVRLVFEYRTSTPTSWKKPNQSAMSNTLVSSPPCRSPTPCTTRS